MGIGRQPEVSAIAFAYGFCVCNISLDEDISFILVRMLSIY